MDIKKLVEKQKEFFQKGNQLDINFRREMLIKLKKIIKDNEQEIVNALKKDLNKSEFESYLSEIAMVYEEINLHIKNIQKWSKRKRVSSSFMFFEDKITVFPLSSVKVALVVPGNTSFLNEGL